MLFREVLCCSGGLYGCSGGLYADKSGMAVRKTILRRIQACHLFEP